MLITIEVSNREYQRLQEWATANCCPIGKAVARHLKFPVVGVTVREQSAEKKVKPT